MHRIDDRVMRIEWKQEMHYVPALRMYLRKGEVMDVPKTIGDNLVLQGFAVKLRANRIKTFDASRQYEVSI